MNITVLTNTLKWRFPLKPLAPENIRYLIVHHAEAETATPEDIHEWHLERDNATWAGFGYNEYVRKDGSVYIGRGDNIGAQCLGYNSISYGICCEGNYETEKEMPQAQKEALIERLKYHKGRFLNAQIVGHKELNDTSCPGRFFPLLEIKKEKNEELEKALEKLSVSGVMDNPDYWRGKLNNVQYLDKLIIKMANKI
ncbi:MAG TPA: peptidoglycan recognition family protein [Clostridia bacterium]